MMIKTRKEKKGHKLLSKADSKTPGKSFDGCPSSNNMSMPANEIRKTDATPRSKPRPRRRLLLNILLSLMVITAGIAGAAYITKSAPKARKRPPTRMAPLVQVISVNPENHGVTVSAMGTAIPAREITLEARVVGEIVFIHPEFTEGGFLEKGSEILRIDPGKRIRNSAYRPPGLPSGTDPGPGQGEGCREQVKTA
jgi:hypothetical protein